MKTVWMLICVLWCAPCFGLHGRAGVTCTPEDLSAVAPRANVDFNTTIQPIIDANCGACHNSRALGGLDMDPGKAVADLVNVPSSTTTAGIPRITPFDLDNSFLFKKINCTDLSLTYGFRMPEAFEPGLPPPPPLAQEDQAAIRDWIVQGALAAAAPPPSIALGGYLSGNWFNPAQGGHGFQLEFTNQTDASVPSLHEATAIWFVYTPDGSGQNWIYAQGPYDSSKNTVTLPATIFHGAKFPFPAANYNPNDVRGSLGDWGSLTFAFTDCDNGTLSWNSGVEGYGSGSMPIQRLTTIAGVSCPK